MTDVENIYGPMYASPIVHRSGVTTADTALPTNLTDTTTLTTLPAGPLPAIPAHDEIDFDIVVALTSGTGSATVQPYFWASAARTWVAPSAATTLTFNTGGPGQSLRVTTMGRACYLAVTAISGTGASLTAYAVLL